MLLRDVQRLTALREMQAYLDDHAAALRGYDSGGARAELDELTDRLGLLSVGQGSHDVRARGARYNERVLADGLRRRFFRPLIDVSKLKDSGLEALRPIRFPFRRTNTTQLVIEARAVIATARPFTARIEHYAGRGFLEEFAAVAELLEASTDVKLGSRTGRVGTTSAIAQLIKRARLVVSAVDALVKAKLPEDDPLIAEWKVLVRAFRSAGRRKRK